MGLRDIFKNWTSRGSRLTTQEIAKTTSRGVPAETATQLGYAFQLFSIDPGYLVSVNDCLRLSEQNFLFKAVTDNICRKVSQPVTRIDVPVVNISNRAARKASDIFNRLRDRVAWEDQKDAMVRAMLCEGGLSWELDVLKDGTAVRAVDRLPHRFIRPLVDEKGRFLSVEKAYRQISESSTEVATFAQWQIVDHNMVESHYHNRGVPHLAAARATIENLALLLKGLVQKWVRSGGGIEHFNIADTTRWTDVELFKDVNAAAIKASPDALVRQFFTKGKVQIERLAGDKSAASDVAVIDFFIDLILMAAGVPKAALGFRSNMVIKDMADLVWQQYMMTLKFVERSLFRGLAEVYRFELMLNGIVPESVPFNFVGGEFEPVTDLKFSPDAVKAGAPSLNDLRKASGAEPDPNPLFDIPGFYLPPDTAAQLAVDRGVAPDWLVEQVETAKQQKKDMAALASSAAVEAAAGNKDPSKVSGQRPPSPPKQENPTK